MSFPLLLIVAFNAGVFDLFAGINDRAGPGDHPMAAKFEITKDKSSRYRFHLKAANGEKGIEAVRTSASAAKVVDLTEREPVHN